MADQFSDHNSSKPPSLPLPLSLSPQDWETLIDDFHSGGPRLLKWTSQFSISSSSLLDLLLPSLLKRDFPLNLKLQLLHFIDEFVSSSTSLLSESILHRLLDTLRAVLQSPPSDALHITFSLKEQLMVSTTSILISLDALRTFHLHFFETLIELLLTVINRPNYGIDRHLRAIACECLRELEKAYPCLLSQVAGHLWTLCQSERTHSSQSYILLFTTVIHNIVVHRSDVSILTTLVPLVPFNVPQFLLAADSGTNTEISSGLKSKELKRAIAFLLESPQLLTPPAMMEFMTMIMPVALSLELQASMLKVQFFGMIYSFDPMLCHVVLMMYLHFLDAFDEQQGELARRLLLISRETQQHLVFRLLVLHWLLGLFRTDSLVGKKKSSAGKMGLSFCPEVFDPLALKTMKLDLLAFISTSASMFKAETISAEDSESGKSVVKLLQDGLVCVSSFKWLPPGSTETAVAFRAFHKFLIGASSHSNSDANTTDKYLVDSSIFRMLQETLVELILESRRLVPVILAFTDRLLRCQKHRWLGESLLQKFDEYLLPKVAINYKLVSCFPLFNRIAENDTVPPRGLLGLFSKFILFLVEGHGPNTGLKSWSQGSKVLGLCRTLLMHHHSSRLFLKMSHLLAFTCLYFPDLEVRDNARIYLRMLICVPGKKLRDLLKLGDQLFGISQSLHSGSLYNVQSPRLSHDINKCRSISSYIHLKRKIPLLVKQSWSLSLSTLGAGSNKPGFPEGIRDTEHLVEEMVTEFTSEVGKIDLPQEPLRVMDSKISMILGILRRHFSCIPDFRHMPGLKVKIHCSLKFDSEPFNRFWGSDSCANSLDDVDNLPAMYATVVKFSSSAPFGPIPSHHIPFLLGEPPGDDECAASQRDSLDIVPVQNGCEKDERFEALVVVELEPRDPTPGLVDVSIESTTGSGQIIRGQLQSITVGLEDLFLRAVVPSDISVDEIPGYYSDLFNALWEACSTSSNTGRETFPLKGGKGVAAIGGTRSVKLLEVPATSLIRATELYLAPFVVSVVGEQLIQIVKDRDTIKNVIWEDMVSENFSQVTSAVPDLDKGPLRLTYFLNEVESESLVSMHKRNMGCFFILIFLPPRFHLLFQMEVSDFSTLVRIRTDHWPCLAYVDDYLEALFLA